MQPKVSVIMSIYNPDQEDIVLKSINSILNQSFKNFEFIIFNDGSTTPNIDQFLKKIELLDSRIIIINSKRNKGLAYGRNECLRIARGKYIALQDDDDISEKERLEKQVKFLDNNRSFEFVGTEANVFYDKKVFGIYKTPRIPQKRDFLWNSPFLNPSMMFRRNVLIKVGGYRVAEETKRAEDYDLFFRLYAKGYRGYNLQEILFNYRINIEAEKHKKYRPMNDRISEAKVRYKGFKLLHMGIKSFPYVMKPIIIGLIPTRLFYRIRKKQYKRDK